jgi:uncharacterized C2H2 Zn-finger protein
VPHHAAVLPHGYILVACPHCAAVWHQPIVDPIPDCPKCGHSMRQKERWRVNHDLVRNRPFDAPGPPLEPPPVAG